MTSVTIDLDDYIEDFDTDDLLDELRRRKVATGEVFDDAALHAVIAILELGRWREALDILKTAARGGRSLSEKERGALLKKYAAARVAA